MRCTGLSYALWLLVVSILIAGSLVSGSSVNRTIDDVHGDSATGALPQYLPEVPASEGPLWFNQTSCAGCADVPDASLAFDNTWTAALYLADIGSMSITMKFSGTAIYVYFIVPNFAKDSGLASVVRCGFFIDGAPVGSFTHNSDGSTKFTYNTLVYSNTTVPNGEHVLLIESTGTDPLIVIFDHAVYTYVPPPLSSRFIHLVLTGWIYPTHQRLRSRSRPPLQLCPRRRTSLQLVIVTCPLPTFNPRLLQPSKLLSRQSFLPLQRPPHPQLPLPPLPFHSL
ncbi:hypothetical protein C8R44DRAFT_638066 [Mycena epipterygia]|nr:hypothetical protein C8R44DRAFT_638066 [Mycena epipterygia]